MINHAFEKTPTPSKEWLAQNKLVRALVIRDEICKFSKIITLKESKIDGQVLVEFSENVPANQRGGLLLDLEECLKKNVDPSLTVWLESQGDKSPLRKLRGIEVKQL